MKTTWIVVTGCIAAAAIAIGCGDSDGGGGSGGGEVTCADGSKSHAITVSCESSDGACIDYRGDMAAQIKSACTSEGGTVVSSCPKPAGYLGSCLVACGTPGEFSMKIGEDDAVDVASAKAGCEGSTGIWFDSQGGGGSGGTGGTGGTGGNEGDTCTENSVPGALVGACEMEGLACIEYRGAGMTATQVEQICGAAGMTYRSTDCPRGDDYLGSCLTDCGQPFESAAVYYSMGGIITEEDMKADCDGKWYK